MYRLRGGSCGDCGSLKLTVIILPVKNAWVKSVEYTICGLLSNEGS